MSDAFVVRKRIMHGLKLYWIGRIGEHGFTFYSDIYAPTGYGYKSKARAERMAREIEQRLLQPEKIEGRNTYAQQDEL